jgi:hypothetical protein
MLKSTKIFTRPDTNVSFFNHQTAITQETRLHISETYMQTGKLISTETTDSPDQLSKNAVSIWNSQADLDQFTNDPVILNGVVGPRTAHNTANGITESTVVEEL